MVLGPDEKVPTLDATLLPPDANPDIERPVLTAGEFPAQFEAVAEGVNPRSVPVIAERTSHLKLGETGSTDRDEILARFLKNYSSTYGPQHFVPEIALYKIRSEKGDPFWSSQNSSMGLRTQQRIMRALDKALPVQGGGSPAFHRARHAIIAELLQYKFASEFGPAATALADLIMELTEDRAHQASISRDLYSRETSLDWFSGVWNRAFFVDQTPFSSPDREAWLVLWSDAWEE